MPLDFTGSQTRYRCRMRLRAIDGRTTDAQYDIPGTDEATAEVNARLLASFLSEITALRVEAVQIMGTISGIGGVNLPAFGDHREYMEQFLARTVGGLKTTIKVPAIIPDVLRTDKRFINPASTQAALFLAQFKAPGNIATLRGQPLDAVDEAFVRHFKTVRGATRIG